MKFLSFHTGPQTPPSTQCCICGEGVPFPREAQPPPPSAAFSVLSCALWLVPGPSLLLFKGGMLWGGVEGRMSALCAVTPQTSCLWAAFSPHAQAEVHPGQEGAARPTERSLAAPRASLQAWLLESPALGELWAPSSFLCT